jgi:hypothetical protein
MPRRTNLFQQVVTILNEHAAGDAVVEESAMLANGVTGEKREVDVLIRSSVAGYEVMIGVEGTAAGRNAGSPWVESMLKKHENLPTSKLVLVSEAGFSKPGRELAEAEGALALSPKDLDPDDPALAVLRGLPSLWPKQVALTPRRCKVVVLADEAPELVEDNPDELLLHTLAGEPIGTVSAYFAAVFDSRFAELAQIWTRWKWSGPAIEDLAPSQWLPFASCWSVSSRLTFVSRISKHSQGLLEPGSALAGRRRFRDRSLFDLARIQVVLLKSVDD